MSAIKDIFSKELFKITSLNSLSVLIKFLVGLVSSKMIAVYVGPNGMALVGNLRNFITTVENVGTLGFQNGVIKYVAEYEAQREQLKRLLSTVVISVLAVTLVLSFFLFFTASYFSDEIFGTDFSYPSVFVALSLCLPWYIASMILVAVLNGLGHFKRVIKINIYGNLLGLVLSVALIYYFQTLGALLSVILAPTMVFFITVFHLTRSESVGNLISFQSFDWSCIRNLSEYSLMALVSAILAPVVYLAIRNNIIADLGLESAGYWEAMTRISSYYFLFLTTLLTVYYLPLLSKATDDAATKRIIWSYFKGIMPVFLFGLIVLYALRDFVLPLIFTKAFAPVSALFFWQLTGDFLKAMSLILGYKFFAKKMTKVYIITELFSLTVLWFSSNYLLSVYGIEGVVMAHAVTYAVYLAVLATYFRKKIF